jgi:hypothetical protein
MHIFKKAPTPDQLPINGPWAVFEGDCDGNIMIVRSNTGYRKFGSMQVMCIKWASPCAFTHPKPQACPPGKRMPSC